MLNAADVSVDYFLWVQCVHDSQFAIFCVKMHFQNSDETQPLSYIEII